MFQENIWNSFVCKIRMLFSLCLSENCQGHDFIILAFVNWNMCEIKKKKTKWNSHLNEKLAHSKDIYIHTNFIASTFYASFFITKLCKMRKLTTFFLWMLPKHHPYQSFNAVEIRRWCRSFDYLYLMCEILAYLAMCGDNGASKQHHKLRVLAVVCGKRWAGEYRKFSHA